MYTQSCRKKLHIDLLLLYGSDKECVSICLRQTAFTFQHVTDTKVSLTATVKGGFHHLHLNLDGRYPWISSPCCGNKHPSTGDVAAYSICLLVI